jgi:hypothetical protein
MAGDVGEARGNEPKMRLPIAVFEGLNKLRCKEFLCE